MTTLIGPPTVAFPQGLDLQPVSRRPTVLSGETLETVLAGDLAWGQTLGLDHIQGAAGRPRASIVVVTFNGLAFTRLCLESLLANATGESLEVIVVDNGSRDGTPDYLRRLAELFASVRPIFNSRNLGFAPAVNQGLEASRGDTLVLLNNDTVVPPGSLRRLHARVADPSIGLAGPVTNRIGNEADVEAGYKTYGELLDFAAGRAADRAGEYFDIGTPIGFCLAFRRDFYERVGPLDERFEVGLFEDDDYAMRCREAGLRAVCVEDAFIHHFGEGSFGELFAHGEYSELFNANRRRFEAKWQTPWRPPPKRATLKYVRLRERIRAAAEALPAGATIAVVSNGDDALLALGPRRGWHFPRGNDGLWGGCHPADSRQAIAQLERVRAAGAQYLLIPQTALWWLEHYDGLRQHLELTSGVVHRSEDACVVFALDAPGHQDTRAPGGAQ